MKRTVSAQASPDIGPEEGLYTMLGKIPEWREKYRGLDALTCPPDGRILSSGGAYGKYRAYMWTIILVSTISWIILTLLRIAVHSFLAYGLKIELPNGHWIYLIPQIILIAIYSYLLVIIFKSFNDISFLVLGIIWLILTLSFEFVGVLVIQKKSLNELFEGWKIWKGNIWTLVLLSHLLIPYFIKIVIK